MTNQIQLIKLITTTFLHPNAYSTEYYSCEDYYLSFVSYSSIKSNTR